MEDGGRGDTLCFLTEKDLLWGGMLADVLKQNKIPFLTQNRLGAGMALKVGPAMERVRFYVPCSHTEQAKRLVDALFAGDSHEN